MSNKITDNWQKYLRENKVSEKILDKEDGEYQRSITKPIKMKEEEGREAAMHRTSLMTLAKEAQELLDMIDDSDDLEEWVESKITKAKEYISAAKDYMAGRDAREDGEL